MAEVFDISGCEVHVSRNTTDLEGGAIGATDGTIGHAQDFDVDDKA